MQSIEKIIAKYLAHEATAKELDQLYLWLAEDSENHKILNRYINAWEQPFQDEKFFNSAEGLKRLNHKIDKTQWISTVWLKIAAAVALLAISSMVIWQLSSSGLMEVSTIVKNNPYGQKSTFQLPDGTIVKLNAGSKLEYPEHFDDHVRLVKLAGEAFFNVQRNEQKPFIVITGEVSTKVLGTSFNINAYAKNKEIKVSVASGKVQVSDQVGRQVYLLPNEEAIYEKSQQRLSHHTVNLDNTLAWKNNTLVFENTSIQEVIKTLTRWYGEKIRTENDAIGHCHITGSFRDETLAHVLQAIELSTNIQYKKENDTLILYGEGCP